MHEWAKCVGYDDEPPMFGVRAWASYLQCIRNSSYYFSVAELLAMCIVSSVNVIIFKETDSVLSYAGGYLEGRGLPVYVRLDCNTIMDGQVRSHFDRLISADVADKYKAYVAGKSKARERDIEEEKGRLADQEERRLEALRQAKHAERNRVDKKRHSGASKTITEASDEPDSGEDTSEVLSAKSLSDASSDDASDAEDVFDLSVANDEMLPREYRHLFLYRWQLAARELCENHLREDLTLPMDPRSDHASKAWTDVDTAVVLPTWHCGFRDCSSNSCNQKMFMQQNHEYGIWHHIWHTAKHKEVLSNIIEKYDLTEKKVKDVEETAFTLMNQAYMMKERQSCPCLGIATDRRSLSHLGEVFFEDNVEVLMCFICGCKHIHHKGFDKFGSPSHKGTIAYRRGNADGINKMILLRCSWISILILLFWSKH